MWLRRIGKNKFFWFHTPFLIQKCKYTGVGHIDLRVDTKDKKVKLIEINPRFWGSLDYSTAIGLNFAHLGIELLEKKYLPEKEPPVGDCPYLPISFIATVRKIIGKQKVAGDR